MVEQFTQTEQQNEKIEGSMQTDDEQEQAMIEKTILSEVSTQTDDGQEQIVVENSDDQMLQFNESNGTEVNVGDLLQVQQQPEQLHEMTKIEIVEITEEDLNTRVIWDRDIPQEISKLSNEIEVRDMQLFDTRMKK